MISGLIGKETTKSSAKAKKSEAFTKAGTNPKYLLTNKSPNDARNFLNNLPRKTKNKLSENSQINKNPIGFAAIYGKWKSLSKKDEIFQ